MDEDLEVQPQPRDFYFPKNKKQRFQDKIEEREEYFEFTPGKYKVIVEPPLQIQKPIIYFDVQPREICETIDGITKMIAAYDTSRTNIDNVRFLCWYVLAQKAVYVCDEFGTDRPSWLTRLANQDIKLPMAAVVIANTFGNFETLEGDFRIRNPVDYVMRFLTVAFITLQQDKDSDIDSKTLYSACRHITWDAVTQRILTNSPQLMHPMDFNPGFQMLIDIEKMYRPKESVITVTTTTTDDDGVEVHERRDVNVYLTPRLMAPHDSLAHCIESIAPLVHWPLLFGDSAPPDRLLFKYLNFDYQLYDGDDVTTRVDTLYDRDPDDFDNIILRPYVELKGIQAMLQECFEYSLSLAHYIRINFVTSSLERRGVGSRTQFSYMYDNLDGTMTVATSFSLDKDEIPLMLIAPWRAFERDRHYKQYVKMDCEVEGGRQERLQSFFMNMIIPRGDAPI